MSFRSIQSTFSLDESTLTLNVNVSLLACLVRQAHHSDTSFKNMLLCYYWQGDTTNHSNTQSLHTYSTVMQNCYSDHTRYWTTFTSHFTPHSSRTAKKHKHTMSMSVIRTRVSLMDTRRCTHSRNIILFKGSSRQCVDVGMTINVLSFWDTMDDVSKIREMSRSMWTARIHLQDTCQIAHDQWTFRRRMK